MTTRRDLTFAVDVMRSFPRPWWVAGGWAIELFAGTTPSEHRQHSDVEIGLWRDDQRALHKHWRARGWSWFRVAIREGGGEWIPWDGTPVDLPEHQLMCRRADHETPAPAEVEFFLNERDPVSGEWICRRDEALRRPASSITTAVDGVPILAPEIQLLYKAKHTRQKDKRDFALVLPRLTSSQRGWLRDALTRVHPGHAWLASLGADS